jgi:hypothetical protein
MICEATGWVNRRRADTQAGDRHLRATCPELRVGFSFTVSRFVCFLFALVSLPSGSTEAQGTDLTGWSNHPFGEAVRLEDGTTQFLTIALSGEVKCFQPGVDCGDSMHRTSKNNAFGHLHFVNNWSVIGKTGTYEVDGVVTPVQVTLARLQAYWDAHMEGFLTPHGASSWNRISDAHNQWNCHGQSTMMLLWINDMAKVCQDDWRERGSPGDPDPWKLPSVGDIVVTDLLTYPCGTACGGLGRAFSAGCAFDNFCNIFGNKRPPSCV